ncbi:MAG TPA: hypothetical protein VM433_15740 [Mycobacteriales bacterium]|nr:hypothetical protein [Mycobacteriales bacterium]
MLARTLTVRGQRDRLDDGLAAVTGEIPGLRDQAGCTGVAVLVDREAGGVILTTGWADQAAMRATAPTLGPLRDRVAAAFGARPEVNAWEIALLHRVAATPDGARARVTWTRADPDMLAQQIDFVRGGIVPEIERLPGFCAASALVDRRTGDGVLTVVYESADALAASRRAAIGLREDAVRRMSARLVDVAELEVLLADLRVPETV